MSTAAFQDAIATWHDFYTLIASVAATLLGLLFVAVSLNLRLFTDDAHPRLRADAMVTSSTYLYLVLVAVVIVAPDPRPTGLAWVLLIFSGIELVATQRESGRVRRLLKSGWHGYLLEVAPSLCYLGVIVLAVGALLGHAQLLVNRWVIGLNVTLLGTATANAWDLLIAAGKAQHD